MEPVRLMRTNKGKCPYCNARKLVFRREDPRLPWKCGTVIGPVSWRSEKCVRRENANRAKELLETDEEVDYTSPAPKVIGTATVTMIKDTINPSHYQGDVECIDALESIGVGVDYCRGNAIKYLWRLGKKGGALEDARKARWYIDRLIKQLEPEDTDVEARLHTDA